MTTIKILGLGDMRTLELRDNVKKALNIFPVHAVVQEVTEFNAVFSSGVSETPALIIDEHIVTEGKVPTVEEITQLLKNRLLMRSKLYQMHKILVPIDFSKSSENAFLFAYELSQAFGSSIEIVHAYDTSFVDIEAPMPPSFWEDYVKTLKRDIKEFVEKMKVKVHLEEGEEVSVDHIKITTKVLPGTAEASIVDLSVDNDLIVMATSGKGGFLSKLLGTVSTWVSSNAHCPVLLVPPDAKFSGFHNVLYASNFESLDSQKIKQIVSFTTKMNSQLHFVHVGKPAEHDVVIEKKLFEINYNHADPKFPFKYSTMLGDNVIEKIQEYAHHHNIDLMVFVTSKRGLWEDFMHKSVTKQMILNTRIPVLVAHFDNDITD